MRHTRHGWWLEEAGRRRAPRTARGRPARRRGGRRRRLSRPLERLAPGRGRRERGRARGCALWTRPERAERGLRQLALGSAARPRRAVRPRAGSRGRPRLGGRRRRDRRLVPGRGGGRVVSPRAPARAGDHPGAGRRLGAGGERLRGGGARRRMPRAVALPRCRRSVLHPSFGAGWRCGRARRCSPRGLPSACATAARAWRPHLRAAASRVLAAWRGRAETAAGRVSAGAAVLAVNARPRAFRAVRAGRSRWRRATSS